jgi:hypothetical protein
MDKLVDALMRHIEGGGAGVGWLLCTYLLLRLHQLTDRQHKANLDTIKALEKIKAMLFGRNSGNDE